MDFTYIVKARNAFIARDLKHDPDSNLDLYK